MIRRWLLAWFASALVWLLLVDTTALPEMLAGVVAAAIAATGFELVRRQRISRARAYPPAVSALPRQLLRVTADLALLTRGVWWALLRKRNHAGTFHSIPFTAREPATDDSRRAAVELIGSLAPNTFVVGINDELVLVHQFASAPGELDAIATLAER